MDIILTLCTVVGAMIVLGLTVTFLAIGVVLGVISVLETIEDIIKRRRGRK